MKLRGVQKCRLQVEQLEARDVPSHLPVIIEARPIEISPPSGTLTPVHEAPLLAGADGHGLSKADVHNQVVTWNPSL